MFRHKFIALAGATLAATLAACYSATPTTSVSTLPYAGAASSARTDPRLAPPRVEQASAEPAPGSSSDPMFRLDMP
jgi:hypothetical protein